MSSPTGSRAIWKDYPVVSVIALCYNHSRYVLECLESIRAQTYEKVQVILLDDCSRDTSVELIEQWMSDHSVEWMFIKHRTNKGICKTLNEGMRHAKGKYIALIGTDDIWLSDKLEHQVRKMETLPEDVGVLYSDAYRIDESGRLLPGMYIESMYHWARKPFAGFPEGHIFPALVENNFIPGMTTLIRKSCYDQVGLYDERLCFEDWDMWFRISRQFTFAYSPIVSAKYRILSTSASRTLLQQRNGWVLGSNFLLREKCLAYSRMSAEDRQALLYVMRWIVERMYELRLVHRHLYGWKLFRHVRSLWTFSMFLFSACGLSYSSFCRSYAWYVRSGIRLKMLNGKKACRS
jgi:glycosyltransferase involved in cell wall biosynthesis